MKFLKSNFESDLKGEAVVIEFLEKYFYSNFVFQTYERMTNMKLQNKGIDLIFSTKSKRYVVDEKSALYYHNGLPTFAFELSYLKKGDLKEGWFYNQKKETEYYILLWIKRNNVKIENITEDDIHEIELMLVHRNEFQQYIFAKYGMNKASFIKAAEIIREQGEYGSLSPISTDSRAKYYYSKEYIEEPINVIFYKDEMLTSGAVKSYYKVTRNGYENIM